MLQASMSENLLVKTAAASHFIATWKFSRRGGLRVYIPEHSASQWRIQRRKCRMKADKVLVVLMTTETAVNSFVFSMTKIHALRAAV